MGDSDVTFGLWNTATGSGRHFVRRARARVYSVAFSPTAHPGRGQDGEVACGTASGKRTAILNEGSLVNSVAFSPNGQTLAVATEAVTSACGSGQLRRTAPCRGERSRQRALAERPGPRRGRLRVTSVCGHGQREAIPLVEGAWPKASLRPNGRPSPWATMAEMSACGTRP